MRWKERGLALAGLLIGSIDMLRAQDSFGGSTGSDDFELRDAGTPACKNLVTERIPDGC